MIWHDWFYVPLLNLLIYLYNFIGFNSLGAAVIALTVVIRVALLPFSIVSERNALAFDRLQSKIRAIEDENRTDPVLMKERIRELLTRHKVSPWAKVAALLFQLLVLIVLYQVFMAGINYELGSLYPFIVRPEAIDSTFYSFELGARSLGWAAAVGVYLFLEIAISLQRRARMDRSDLAYLVFFPLFVFFVLWYLPMVKSLFILTSLIFSSALASVRLVIFRVRPGEAAD
ncbi:hypothetical protein EPN90_03240 [Patescibacteria group bacterium]|nr:MAG: hypothetical protein EPN90_03240 [Patescibacteria group bacterium]